MNRIKEHRKRLGLTQAQLAERIGGDMDQSKLSKLENGTQELTVTLMRAMATALEINPADLIDNAAVAELRTDVIPNDGSLHPSILAPLKAKGIRPFLVKTPVLSKIGHAAGESLLVDCTDIATSSPKTGDIVIAEASERGDRQKVLILRQFIAPDLLTTNRRVGRNASINLDDPAFDIRIVGVILPPQ